MSRDEDGLYYITVGYTKYFEKLEFQEALSGLLTVADHFNGRALVDDLVIADFRRKNV